MKLFLILFLALFCWADVLWIDVPISEYQITENEILMDNGVYIHQPGAPNLPGTKLTIALPPGAIFEYAKFYGARKELGEYAISATQPALPLINDKAADEIWDLYDNQKEKFYSYDEFYPQDYGAVISRGGLRKYVVVDVVCYPFAYRPVSKKLYYTPNLKVAVHYTMPHPGSERARFWKGLMDDITFDEIAKKVIFNWDDAQTWYKTDHPKRANDYYIIIPSSIQSSVDNLVAWRQAQGYDVNVVTVEYIESNMTGDDLQQKIRNYLREKIPDIEYVLLVGFSTDLPWRNMVPFNNDPDSPYNDPIYSPIPSDLYYAELTDHDSLSWNSDRDAYYGEVFDASFQPPGDDDPDYHADVHLGRIPHSTQSTIEDICDKLISFDSNIDPIYKTASLLAGAVYYYANEDNGGNQRNDGADYMEELMNDSVLERSNAVYLYEKGGLGPCTLSCTDSLTRDNMIAYWQQKGIMYECHHGNNYLYARKLWASDDGDGVPEYFEISWPTCLSTSYVNQLDNIYPATSVLRSCLCGNPDVTGLGAQLLHHGASSVISSSRVCWMSYSDPGGIPYHFFDHLIKDTTLSHGIIGNSYDIARNEFMDASGFWLPAYHYNLFGDPALHQHGTLLGIEEIGETTNYQSLLIYPNPTFGAVNIQFYSLKNDKVELNIYDESGRFVKNLYNGYLETESKTLNTKLPAGIYFLKLKQEDNISFKKFVVVH